MTDKFSILCRSEGQMDILGALSDGLRLFLICSHCICHPRSKSATINLAFLDILETAHVISVFLFSHLTVLRHSTDLPALANSPTLTGLLQASIALFDHLAACIMAELQFQFRHRAFGPFFTEASLKLLTVFLRYICFVQLRIRPC